jgi:hypothetical protein
MQNEIWETALPIGLLSLTYIFVWLLSRDKRENPKFNLLSSLLANADQHWADHQHRHAA